MVQQLNERLTGLEGKGRGDYDALCLFSGGKDSCLVLHELKERHPALRVLALTVDNFFQSPEAKANVERTIRLLDTPHLTYRPPWSVVKKLYRYTLTHVKREDHYPPTDLMDGHLTFFSGYRVARDLGIPAIIAGLARAQSQSVLGLKSFSAKFSDLEKVKFSGVGFFDILDEEDFPRFPSASPTGGEQDPEYILPLYVWNLSEGEVIQRVESLGLIEGRASSPVATNNQLIPVASLVEAAQFGFTKFEIEFAKMIRQGRADRFFWLHIFEMLEFSAKTGRFIDKSVDDILGKLDLKREDVGLK